jgi:hypothetical protein
VSCQFHIPSTLLRGKIAQYPLDRRLGGPQSWSWWHGERKFLILLWTELWSLHHPACSQVVYWPHCKVPMYRGTWYKLRKLHLEAYLLIPIKLTLYILYIHIKDLYRIVTLIWRVTGFQDWRVTFTEVILQKYICTKHVTHQRCCLYLMSCLSEEYSFYSLLTSHYPLFGTGQNFKLRTVNRVWQINM